MKHILKKTILLMLLAATPAVMMPAWAHAKLTSSDPAADASVKPPKLIKLTFAENLEPAFSGAELTDAAGKTRAGVQDRWAAHHHPAAAGPEARRL